MPYMQHLMKVVDHLFQYQKGQDLMNTYAILDAARDDVIYPKLAESEIEGVCLFHGSKAEELAEVAPYLVHLRKDDPFTEWVLNSGWGKSWGIFVQSEASLNDLQRHFRSFLTVYDEEGKPLYFRFYDPRVLRVYLPTCNAGEIKAVFGPVGTYLLEDEDASILLRFSGTNGKLQVEQKKLEGFN